MKSNLEITEAYLEKRSHSKKAKAGLAFQEVWRMISEQFRLLGSSFVSICNRRDGGEGGRFMRNYERYMVESEEELNVLLHLLERESIDLDQREVRFRYDSIDSKATRRMARSKSQISKLIEEKRCFARYKIYRSKLLEMSNLIRIDTLMNSFRTKMIC